MKNFFKLTAPTLAATTLISLTAFTVFASGPTSTPTGGNVDANFNSLSIGPVGSEALILNSSGELSTKTGDFNPVKINDTYGLRLDSTIKGFESVCTDPSCTAAGYFNSSGNTGVSAVANGAAGMGGSFTGTFLGAFGSGTGAGSTGVSGNGVAKGVAGTATAGVGGDFTGTTYGVKGTASAAGSTGGSFTGNLIGVSGTANSAGAFGVNGSSSGSNGKGVVGSATGDLGIGVFGFVSGAGATTSKGVAGQVNAGAPASAVAGSFVNQNGSNNDAYLGTNSYAVQAAGNSDLQGIILNTSVTSGGSVAIADDDGLLIGDTSGASSVAAKSLLGDYTSVADFTGNFQFGPFSTASMLTDFNATGGIASYGNIYTTGMLIKDPNSGISIDSDNGGITITTKNGGQTIYSSAGGGLTVNTASGGITVSKNDGTFLGKTTANIDSATGNVASAGTIFTTDGTNSAALWNSGWVSAVGGGIYSAATDWSNWSALWPTGDITGTGNLYIKDITASGHIRGKTLGFWYTSTSSTNEIAPGGGLYAAQVSCFPGTGSYATGCGAYLTNSSGTWSANGTGAKTVLYSIGRSPGTDDTCQATYVNNDAVLKQYFKLQAYCFTPDS